MATIPEPERVARELLNIMVTSGRARAGTSIQTHRLQQKFGLLRHADDYANGLRFAITAEWLELTKDGSALLLTDKGFAEA